MKRIVINKPGSFIRLKIENFEIDQPKDYEVLVRTEFIGGFFADCLVRMGDSC
jgi:NADPH:quinone reductase-like Zn-dependent oxidoreductase